MQEAQEAERLGERHRQKLSSSVKGKAVNRRSRGAAILIVLVLVPVHRGTGDTGSQQDSTERPSTRLPTKVAFTKT